MNGFQSGLIGERPMALKVLLAERDEVEAILIARALSRVRLDVEAVPSAWKLLTCLESGWSAVIIGEGIGWPSGAELVRRVRDRGFDGAVVAIVRESYQTSAARLREAGACEVVPRFHGYQEMLPEALFRAIERLALQRQLEAARLEARRLAAQLSLVQPNDPVTGLPAGWYLTSLIREERRRARATGRSLAVVTARLAGGADDAERLVRVADAIRVLTRPPGFAGLVDSDTFVVVLPEQTEAQAWAFVQRAAASLGRLGEDGLAFSVKLEHGADESAKLQLEPAIPQVRSTWSVLV